MVALHDGQPKLLNLKQVLEAFLAHRREVVTRRTIFDLTPRLVIALTCWKGSPSRWPTSIEVIELIKGIAVAGRGSRPG